MGMIGFDFDECQYRLEDIFQEMAMDGSIEDPEVVRDVIFATVLLCGGSLEDDEVVECVSTAAHNANVAGDVAGPMGF